MNSSMRWMSTVVAALSLTACAQQPTVPQQDLAVTGELNLGATRMVVYIEGEKVAEGLVPVPDTDNEDPAFSGSQRYVFPLRGEYRGQPVTVECQYTPWAGGRICAVALDGVLIERLVLQ